MPHSAPRIAILLALAAVTAAYSADDSPDTCRLTLLAPEVTPLSKTPFHLEETRPAIGETKRFALDTTTDTAGIARFSWPAGPTQMDVTVPGIGYGRTGVVLVVPGQPGDVPRARLAPFGHIEGTLPPQFRTPGVTIHTADYYNQIKLQTTANPDGTFHLDAPDGTWRVWAENENHGLANCTNTLQVTPGQTTAVTLTPVVPAAPWKSQPETRKPFPGEGQKAAWTEGTLTDTAGTPIPHATVYAMGTYFGGLRMYEQVVHTTTDNHGHYVLTGDAGLDLFTGTILATADGFTPAWAFFSIDQHEEFMPVAETRPAAPPPLPPQKIDLVLSRTGGALDVPVLQDEKPARGMTVVAWLEGANLRDQWAAGGGPDHDAIEALAYPSAITDDHGVAHFTNLVPGLYRILAANAQANDIRYATQFVSMRLLKGASNQAFGIPVRAGETSTAKITIAPPPSPIRATILDLDGNPLRGNIPFNWGPSNTIQFSSGRMLTDGAASLEFQHNGWWKWNFQYRPIATSTVPMNEPYDEADGYAAISNWYTQTQPLMVREHPIVPGSIHITVADNGKPLNGVVTVGTFSESLKMATTLDAHGDALFERVQTWKQTLTPFVDGFESPLFGLDRRTETLPPDESLLNRRIILPVDVVMRQNHREEIAFHPESVGFVRGTVHLPRPQDLRSLEVYVRSSAVGRAASAKVNPATGQFVAGPFLPGIARLVFQFPNAYRMTRDASIEPGKITRLDLDAPSNTTLSAHNNQLLLGVGGARSLTTSQDPLHGTVYLHDGKTPAHGAQLLFIPADEAQASFAAITDALGTIHPRPLWISRSVSNERPSGDAIVVAFLPGNSGATIHTGTIPAPLKIVLPEPIALKGRVTVAGNPFTGKPGSIHLLAEYQGNPLLRDILSVQTTANADGDFELAGLTPGDYRLQAALDDIWFSESIALHVPASPSPNLAIDIPASSAEATIHILNPDGTPRPGTILHISRPQGPLEQQFAPKDWTADGTGSVNVPTLETGIHLLTTEDGTDQQNLVASPTAPATVILRITRASTTAPAQIPPATQQ